MSFIKFKFSLESKILLIVLSGLFFSSIFIVLYYFYYEQGQLERLLIKQSRYIFKQVQITRRWNASHGGVYVIMKDEEQPNPYLYKVSPGQGLKAEIEPILIDQKGRRLGLINPATMTRQLSVDSELHNEISFHLTSLLLINPDNKPDAFEKASLTAFEEGAVVETTKISEKNGQPYFRYMAPLKISQDCLRCHGFQGYQVGDIRGGISVSIPMSEELNFSHRKRFETLAFVALIFLFTILLLSISIRRLISKPINQLTKMGMNIGNGKLAKFSIYDSNDEIGKLGSVLVKSDLSIQSKQEKLESYAKVMTNKALFDSLTKLANRELFFDRLNTALTQAQRYSFRVAILFIDLDHFKFINDELGHEMGDELLAQVAARLQTCVRKDDTVARIGGDEFAILLSHLDCHREDWDFVAEKIIAELSSVFILNGNEYSIGCSIGISEFPDNGKFATELLRKADEAMYAVKHSSKNNFIHYSSKWDEVISMSNSEIDHDHLCMLDMVDAINNKIEENEFDKTEILRLIDHLYANTIEHFRREESLLVEHSYPNAETHGQIHQQILQQLKKYRSNIEQAETNRQQCADIFFTIKDLLISHVLIVDVKYIQYLRKN